MRCLRRRRRRRRAAAEGQREAGGALAAVGSFARSGHGKVNKAVRRGGEVGCGRTRSFLQKDTNSPICFRALFLGIPGTFLIDFADYWGLLVSTSKNYILAIFFHSSLHHFFSKRLSPFCLQNLIKPLGKPCRAGGRIDGPPSGRAGGGSQHRSSLALCASTPSQSPCPPPHPPDPDPTLALPPYLLAETRCGAAYSHVFCIRFSVLRCRF